MQNMEKRRLIWVLLDGLNVSAALERMCFLQALTVGGKATFQVLDAMLPPLSRPVYATLLTGKTPLEHGILRNEDHEMRSGVNIFSQAVKFQKIVCAAAYFWFLELVCGLYFDQALHKIWQKEKSPINQGIFYSHDDYPNSELFGDGEFLRLKYNPDLLLIHGMGIDNAGHMHGGNSEEYKLQAAQADALLARYMPVWLQAGYGVIVMSDHGMGKNKLHYELDPQVLQTPLWLAGKALSGTVVNSQSDIPGIMADYLKIPFA